MDIFSSSICELRLSRLPLSKDANIDLGSSCVGCVIPQLFAKEEVADCHQTLLLF